MNITMKPVESSQIYAIGYDEATKTLAVQFKSGGPNPGPGSVYHYLNVPHELYVALATAESVGSYFGKHIKPFRDRYPFVKVETKKAAAT